MSLLKPLLTACFYSLFIFSAYSAPILKNMNGETILFSELAGKWVFINYWASWCGPCLDEIPVFNRFYEAHKKSIALFAVNYDALPENKQATLIKKYNIRYPSLKEDPSGILNLGDIRGVPATFVFTPEGKFYDVLYGAQTQSSLNHILEE